MSAICKWGFGSAVVLAAALFLTLRPTSAFAYTPEQQQACTPDAMRLCGSYVPDVDRITACMIARKSQLSPECRRFFRAGPEPVAGQPTNIGPATARPVRPTSTKAKKPKKPKPAAT